MGTNELDPAKLRKLGKAQFERLCYHVLLTFELDQRHTWPWVLPDGPGGEVGQTDGGCDFSLDIKARPHRPLAEFRYAITADETGITWYSCKNTKQEDNARKLVLRDVSLSRKNLQKLWTGTEDPSSEIKEECSDGGTLSKQLLEVLVNGGRYFVLIAAQVPKKSDLQKSVVAKLEYWCATLLGKTVDLRTAVRIIDANDLAQLINHHGLKLPRDIELELDIGAPRDLLTWSGWKDQFESDRGTDRGNPSFALDSDRQEKLAQIMALTASGSGDSRARHEWIAGPPGMGKTRMVLEALEKVPAHERRVSFTEDPDAALRAMASSWFSTKDDAIVVVDECSDARADELIHAFRHNNGARRNSLILIGPLPEAYARPRWPPSVLSKLPNPMIRELIRDVAKEVSFDDATLDLKQALALRNQPVRQAGLQGA